MIKRLLTGLVLACMALGAGAALDAEAVIKDTTEALLDKLKANKEVLADEPERLYSLVNEIVVPHFDFDRMSRLVLGQHWRRADAAQQEKFKSEFQTLLVRTYASSLNEYQDEEIHYPETRDRPSDDKATVRQEVAQPGGQPIPIQYRLHQVDGEWKVYDVTIDGVNLVTNYRSTFAKEIRRGGLDGLINKLEERNRSGEGI